MTPSDQPSPTPAKAVRRESAGRYFPTLDGLRGLAILLVLIHHWTFIGHDGPAIDVYFARLTHIGYIGVDLFFVLSGFLITRILLDSKDKVGYFRNFYARRTLRIFPLYYGFLLFVFVLMPLLGRTVALPGTQVWYWLYGSNFLLVLRGGWGEPEILAITWSLAIEEQFYLVWPAVIWWVRRERLKQLCLTIIVGSLLLRIALVFLGYKPIVSYVLVFTRADCLAIGALIAVVFDNAAEARSAYRRMAIRVMAFASAIIVAIFAHQRHFMWDVPLYQTLGYSAFALFWGSAVALTLLLPAGHWICRPWESALMRFLGRYSYGIYLFHTLVFQQVSTFLPTMDRWPRVAGSQLPFQVIAWVAYLVPTVLAAWICFHLYERPFLQFKRFFQPRNPERSMPPAP